MAKRAGWWWVVAGALALASCSNDGGATTAATESGNGAPVVLKAPPGTSSVTLAAAADGVRQRLARMNVGVVSVDATPDGVAVSSSADPYQLEAAARQRATSITPLAATAIGPCQGPGYAGVGPAARCYLLGAPLTGTGAVANATPEPSGGAGWKVTFSVDPNQYTTFRAPIEAAMAAPIGIVADGEVVLAFTATVPALNSAIGPGLTEEQARAAAAALAVDNDLPVALSAPELPPPAGARVNLDFWTAALGAKVCGTWLANVPASGLDTGVHSHGDGLVYVHPMKPDEAGNHATLGLYLQRGGWSASADRLALWDGGEHRTGDRCPGGGPATVRWYVDGVEQTGDPSAFVPRSGQAIVLSFGDDADQPGDPPQAAALALPALGATASA